MTFRSARLTLAFAALTVASACAHVRVNKDDARDLAAADGYILEGCYDCLSSARDIYARLATGTDGAAVATKLFETDVLLTLREKEIGLASQTSLTRARDDALRVPSTLDAQRLLAIVGAILPDTLGVAPRRLATLRRMLGLLMERFPAERAWLDTVAFTPTVRAYVAMSLQCAYDTRPQAPRHLSTVRPSLPADAPPLVVYGRNACGDADVIALSAVRAAVPAFVETSFILAKPAFASAKETGGDDALALLADAHTKFAQSPSVTFLLGEINKFTGQCADAVRYYDETIALEPEHENALFGRTICLTSLQRGAEAIATATRMIDLHVSDIAHAYYWRAINQRLANQLTLARSDIELAKAVSRGDAVDVLTIAGMIEFEQDSLSVAERDLRMASAGNNNCTAVWYLARVLGKAERWAESGTQFEGAMRCYDWLVDDGRAKVVELQQKSEMNAQFRARSIARIEADIAENRSFHFASAFNGANNTARSGNLVRARELVEIAAQDPALADVVEKLRKALAGG